MLKLLFATKSCSALCSKAVTATATGAIGPASRRFNSAASDSPAIWRKYSDTCLLLRSIHRGARCQLSISSTPDALLAPRRPRTPIAAKWAAAARTTTARDEYAAFREEFLRRYAEKQQRIQEAFSKLCGLRRRRAQREAKNGAAACRGEEQQQQPFDVCGGGTRAIYAESDLKINCMRATECMQVCNLTVAADRMAEAGVQKFEQSLRERKANRQQPIGESLLLDVPPMFRD